MVIPTWFLYVSGFSLIVLGGMQIQQRPRREGANLYERFVNLGTIWSLLCIAVGIGLVTMALGYIDPFGPPPKPPAKHRR
jgi:hypothetical protein